MASPWYGGCGLARTSQDRVSVQYQLSIQTYDRTSGSRERHSAPSDRPPAEALRRKSVGNHVGSCVWSAVGPLTRVEIAAATVRPLPRWTLARWPVLSHQAVTRWPGARLGSGQGKGTSRERIRNRRRDEAQPAAPHHQAAALRRRGGHPRRDR